MRLNGFGRRPSPSSSSARPQGNPPARPPPQAPPSQQGASTFAAHGQPTAQQQSAAAANTALNHLNGNPAQYMQTRPTRIFQHDGPSGQVTYCLQPRPQESARPGSILGTHTMHPAQAYNARPASQMAAFGGTQSGAVFNAHAITVNQGLNNVQFYNLNNTGPNKMVTTQLSGCSFLMRPGASGGVDVAHARPPAGTSGADFARQLQQRYPEATIYGPHQNYDSRNRLVSIMGSRDDTTGQWRLYAQKQEADGRAYPIKSAHQIWPEDRKL